MSNQYLDPDGVYECSDCGSYFYGCDGKSIKDKQFCNVCLSDYFEKIYKERKSHIIKNFFLYIFPYLILLIGFLAYCLFYLFKVADIGSYIFFACMCLSIINLIISSIHFVSNRDIMSEIGDPESVLVTTSGTIHENGDVDAVSKGYDVYSTGQNISIIGNILKGIGVFILITFFGWIYFIVFLSKLLRSKKLYKRMHKIVSDKLQSEVNVTSFMWCNADTDFDQIDCKPTVKNITGEMLTVTDDFKFLNTFIKDNFIYVALLYKKENTLNFIKILPGYDNVIIEEGEGYDSLFDYFQSLKEKED